MRQHSEVVVVGGGPAGLAAAARAAAAGRSVVLLDDNHSPGGQIWRSGVGATAGRRRTTAGGGAATKLQAVRAFESSGARLLCSRRVVDAPRPGALQVLNEATETMEGFTYEALILTTGARERFLPFPGWTLPGVFGAGGLQALVKGGFPVAGKRIVVAGTGPLLLAIAAHLRADGATIVSIAEQAGWQQLAPFGMRLVGHPGKMMQGLRYRLALRGVPYRTGCWPAAAEGTTAVSSVRLTNGRRTWSVPCDLLACGFHLVPNTELASLVGCAIQGDTVVVDALQRTSVPQVFCAGEPTGVAGLDAALVEGSIAGLAAAGRAHEARRLFPRRDRERSFGAALSRGFALRRELGTLAHPETIVCRCEDVRYRQLAGQPSWTEAKLQTRCGMGSCQGRICGPAVETLFGWRNSSVRPPIFPVPLAAFLHQEWTSSSEEFTGATDKPATDSPAKETA